MAGTTRPMSRCPLGRAVRAQPFLCTYVIQELLGAAPLYQGHAGKLATPILPTESLRIRPCATETHCIRGSLLSTVGNHTEPANGRLAARAAQAPSTLRQAAPSGQPPRPCHITDGGAAGTSTPVAISSMNVAAKTTKERVWLNRPRPLGLKNAAESRRSL